MIKKIPVAGLFFFCFFPIFVAAQGYSYVNYNIREGLAGSMVYCMAQDKDGFIWIGTETGLSRFDGKRFVNFTTKDGLSDNEIIKIIVDSKNRVWIMPFQTRVCYFYKGKLCTDENDSLLKKIPYKGGVTGIVENEKHEVAVVQPGGVTVIGADNSVTNVFPDSPNHRIGIFGLNFEGGFMGNVIDYNFPTIHYYTISGNKFVHYMDEQPLPNLSSNGIYTSRDLRIFFNHPESLIFITPAERFVLQVPGFTNMSRLNDSLVAVTATDRTTFINFKKRITDGVFLENENISTALEDREGNLWFASMGKGVYRLASRKFKAANLIVKGNNLPVYSMTKHNNSLLIGSSNFMLWKLDLASSQLSQYVQAKGVYQGRILTLDIAGNNEVMAGTDAGMYKMEGSQLNRKTHFFSIKSTFVDNDTLYISHNAAVEAYFLPLIQQGPHIYMGRTTSIYKRRDSFYLGTLKGLYIKTATGPVDSLGKVNPAVAGRISAIEETTDGTIWIGTYGNGVASYSGGAFPVLLNQSNGLTSNIVRTMFADGTRLWVGTDKGLNKVEPINGSYKITRYTNADGIMSDIVNAIYVDSNTVYVGTPGGLSWFREDEVFTNSMCVLRLTGIQSDKQGAVADTANLQFEHYDSDIRFEFTGISFKSAGEITYRYRLSGLDQNWHTTTDNFLNYPTLPSGGYVLEVQAVNKFGVESELLRIEFFIEKLLWEKTWFRILFFLLITGLVWIFVSWRIRTIRRQAELRTETNSKMAELEQMALKAQMNPHFIFNSLNSIQHYMFDKDVESANRYITEFSRLIRLTLEFSSKTKVSLEDEVRFLGTYLELETRRFEGKFKYQIRVDKQLDQAHIYVPPMILQPYIENSIRHGIRYREDNDGVVTLDFSSDGDFLVISIEDNGVGRERSKQLKGPNNIEYQSKGMNLTARRIEMINKSSKFPINIDISDIHSGNRVAGTRVMIRIPLPK